MPPIQFVVDRREAGKTLAAVLKSRFGISWAQAKRLVEKQHVKVSGQVETDVARRVKLGKRVELAAERWSEERRGRSRKEPARREGKPRVRRGNLNRRTLPLSDAPDLGDRVFRRRGLWW